MNKKHDIHEFALYFKKSLKAQTHELITDKQTIHRITHVLRLAIGDTIVFFNEHMHAHAQISALDGKTLDIFVHDVTLNQVISPQLTICLPLLKREALDEAVTLLAAVGVTSIELFISEKVQRSWGGQHEYDRLYRCMIAAAEQSKNFALPTLSQPIPLTETVTKNSLHKRFVCDATGTNLISEIMHTVTQQTPITLLVGPEGDFTAHEKELITRHEYRSWRLTNTILRAESAAFLAAGIVRSC